MNPNDEFSTPGCWIMFLVVVIVCLFGVLLVREVAMYRHLNAPQEVKP